MKKIWTLEFTPKSKKQFEKLAPGVQKSIFSFFKNRILINPNPYAFGKPLQNTLIGLWRFRIGDYRVICQMQEDTLVMTIIKTGHRKDVYKF